MSILTPLMIRTFGRTGSTLLMQVLGTSDKVCFERQYPFEHRYLTFVCNISRIIGLPQKSDSVWNNDTMFSGKSHRVGPLPYPTIEAFNQKAVAERSICSLWEDFSAEMRKTQGLTLSETAYYAEKVPNEVAAIANEHLAAKNIFLLRDPRDEMVSIKKFNQKRGFNSFGWQKDDSDASYAERMCNSHRAFLKNLTTFETNPRRIAVRYEDLVQQGHEEVERLSEWLGETLCIDTAQSNTEIRERHMTSTTTGQSVERWKSELSPDVLGIFSRELGSELSTLGYTV